MSSGPLIQCDSPDRVAMNPSSDCASRPSTKGLSAASNGPNNDVWGVT